MPILFDSIIYLFYNFGVIANGSAERALRSRPEVKDKGRKMREPRNNVYGKK